MLVFPPGTAHPQVTPGRRRPPGSALHGTDQVLAAAALPPLARCRASRRSARAGPFLRLGASRDATARGPGSAPQGFGDPSRLQPLPKGATATREPTAFLFHHHNLPGVTTDFLAPFFPSPNRSFRLSTLPRNAVRCVCRADPHGSSVESPSEQRAALPAAPVRLSTPHLSANFLQFRSRQRKSASPNAATSTRSTRGMMGIKKKKFVPVPRNSSLTTMATAACARCFTFCVHLP